MNIYNFSTLIQLLRKASNYQGVSNETFVSELIDSIVHEYDIRNKNNDVYVLTKSKISDLMRNKRNIPSCLREAISRSGSKDRIGGVIEAFTQSMLDAALLDDTIMNIKSSIANAENITDSQKKIVEIAETNNFLTEAFILALKTDNVCIGESSTVIWSNGTNVVDVIAGDIFKYGFDNRKKDRSIIVIPVNTSFETHITTQSEKAQYQLVSDNTLHGMWLSRMYKAGNKETDLQERIDANLSSCDVMSDGVSASSTGRKYCYPVGTISTIINGNNVFYLIAIAAFDEHSLSHSSAADIEKCVAALISHYDMYGQGDHLYIPLIGTGRSRANLSNQSSFDLIVSTMMKNKDKLHGHISIVILPEAINNIKFERKFE